MAKRYVELKYGVIVGLGICTWMVVEFLLGFHGERMEIGKYSGYFAFIIPLFFYWIALKEKRNRVYNGSLRLSQGLRTSILISILVGLILGGFQIVYYKWINPGFVELAVTQQIDELRAQGLSEEELVTSATGMLVLLSAPAQAIIAFVSSIVEGTLIGFVYTLILKRKTAVVLPEPPANEPDAISIPQQPAEASLEAEPEMPTQDIVTDLHINSNENTLPGGPSA